MNLVFALSIAALAMTAGLALACFVRAFGLTFLALPRSAAVEGMKEAHWTCRVSMMFLALLALGIGLAPGIVLRPLVFIPVQFVGASASLSATWMRLDAGPAFGTLSPVLIALMLGFVVFVAWAGLRAHGANSHRRSFETWSCGRALQTAAFEFTAAAFANPFKRVFGFLYRPVQEVNIEAHPESRFFVSKITYRNESRSIIEDSIYAPIGALVRRLALRVRVLQSGNVHGYLLYILLALIALLMFAK